jgi:hypothetical protein
MKLRESIEKMLWKEYNPDHAPNMEELTDRILQAVRESILKMEPMMLDLPNWEAAYNQATIDMLKLLTSLSK